MDVNCTISVSILKLDMNGTKFECTKVTHKDTHEKLDGIHLEGYAYYLSNQTQFHMAKVCRKRTGPIPISQRGL